MTKRKAALREAALAGRQHAIALSGQLAVQSEQRDISDPPVAALLAAAAWRTAPTGLAEKSMLDVLAQPFRAALTLGSGRLSARTARLWPPQAVMA